MKKIVKDRDSNNRQMFVIKGIQQTQIILKIPRIKQNINLIHKHHLKIKKQTYLNMKNLDIQISKLTGLIPYINKIVNLIFKINLKALRKIGLYKHLIKKIYL